MATETGRIIKRKRVKLPGGGTVDIPVIVQITFQDVPERGQETQYTLDNSAQSDRNIHVAAISSDGTTNENPGSDLSGNNDLQVERIDLFRVVDVPSRAQESFFAPDSKTVAQPPDAPPYFTTHFKTHIVRYLNTPDDGNSIDSELIDEIHFGDAPDRGQDSYVRLLNPPDNSDITGITVGDQVDDGTGTGNTIYTVQVDPNLEDVSDSNNGIDPPWRTDPFQNIVRVSGHYVLFLWIWSDRAYNPDAGDTRCLISQDPTPPFGLNYVYPTGQLGILETNNATVDMIGDIANPMTKERLVNVDPVEPPDNPVPPDMQIYGTPYFDVRYKGRSRWYPNDNDNWTTGPVTFAQVAAPNPNPPPLYNLMGDPIPQVFRSITYLFSAEPSSIASGDNPTSEEPDRFFVKVDHADYPWPERLHGGQTVLISEKTYTPTRFGGGTNFPSLEIHVYSKADVKLHLEDKIFPLRLKGDDTDYQDDPGQPFIGLSASVKANTNTRWKAKSITYGNMFDKWEMWPGTPVGTDQLDLDATQVGKNNMQYAFRFGKYKFPLAPNPDEEIPVVWPVTPVTETHQDGEGHDFRVGGYNFTIGAPIGDSPTVPPNSSNYNQHYVNDANKYIRTGRSPTETPDVPN